MTTMHPDAAAVYHSTWAPNAPNVRSGGEVTVKLVAKRLSDSTTTDYQAADAIARRLVTNARLSTRWTTPINGEHVRTYVGDGLTDLAIRRG